LILVGDQNQLPHMLEPDVERALGEVQDDGEPHELKRSLFERLYDHVLRLEQSDGIQRCVMLDTQYRMHPVLGDFVGEAFYASAGGLNSGRDPGEFHHDLPGYEGKVAAWIDVPPHEGREQPGRSKSRRAEARRLATELRRLLDHDALGELSFGVITFYSRQEELLWQELAATGVAERRDGDAGYAIRPAYATAQDGGGRLRTRVEIGTVDAFQGKEFDVVFLSAVRSNTLPATDEAEVRRKYGHLTLPNRLCVAMSRQQRLLIVVGDASMASAEEAATHVPALHAYHALCQGEHGVVRT
jgi:superfamily I DNA and/or RNA helicase